MKQSMDITMLVIFTLLIVFPLAAMSEVKVTLKNGRDIIADDCSDSKGKIVCVKMGGTFEVEKKDILRVSGIRTEKKLSDSGAEDASGEAKKDGMAADMEDKTGSRIQETGIPEADKEGKIIRGTDPEAEKRLDEIHERKLQLSAEAEKLNIEKQQVKEEMKKAPVMLTEKQFDDLNKRNLELESRINRFNEQVRALNAEEKTIIEGLRVRQLDSQPIREP